MKLLQFYFALPLQEWKKIQLVSQFKCFQLYLFNIIMKDLK